MCCNENMIYLGKNTIKAPITQLIGDIYNYCCSKCGKYEWSTEKERCKYKWYKYDKNSLKELLKAGEE